VNYYVMTGLEKSPIVIERLLLSIPATEYGKQTDPDRFNIREAIAHLADWEPFWLERFTLCREHPGSTIKVYDEGQIAIDHKYNESDPRQEVKRFAEGRKALSTYLSTFTEEDWAKELNHPERGLLSLGEFSSMIIGHDLYHIEHLTQYLP
jgi:DinB family protein